MRKILLLFLVPVLTVALSGCKSDSLSSSKIIKLANKQLEDNHVAEKFVTVNVGTYECNDADARLSLRKLAAADLVTYQVERYAWWEKYYKKVTHSYKERVYGYYWWNYEDVTRYRTTNTLVHDFCDHYVVTVALTEKGEKLVTELPEEEEKVDEDMVENLPDPDTYIWNVEDLTEEWPNIENPFIEKKNPRAAGETRKDGRTDNRGDSADENRGNSRKTEADNKVERIDSTRFASYNSLSLDSEEVVLKAVCLRAFKARNIQKYTGSDGTQHAKAEILYETYKATDAGRILGGYEDGEKKSRVVDLIYYEDKGWVINGEN